MPHLLRLVCTLKSAGVGQVAVIWNDTEVSPPDLFSTVFLDSRTAGVGIEVMREAPAPDDARSEQERIVLVRGDRVFHRGIPKALADAAASQATSSEGESAAIVAIDGDEHDGVVVTSRARARELVAAADVEDGWTTALMEARAGASAVGRDEGQRGGDFIAVEAPWRGFTVAARDRGELRQAEKLLVVSLRKPHDGLMATVLNRYVSLFFTAFLCKTRILPNHVTGVCFLLAMAGGALVASGGYGAAVLGLVCFELGSIFDGIDGELSRLSYHTSRTGEWLDTLCDDFANLLFVLGATNHLVLAGAEWALPLGIITAVAFVTTQGTQYYLMITRYETGDLMALPWADTTKPDQLASDSASLGKRLVGLASRTLKRDFFVTLFLVLTALGRLDAALLFFSFGALAFFVILPIQLVRLRMSAAAGSG